MPSVPLVSKHYRKKPVSSKFYRWTGHLLLQCCHLHPRMLGESLSLWYTSSPASNQAVYLVLPRALMWQVCANGSGATSPSRRFTPGPLSTAQRRQSRETWDTRASAAVAVCMAQGTTRPGGGGGGPRQSLGTNRRAARARPELKRERQWGLGTKLSAALCCLCQRSPASSPVLSVRTLPATLTTAPNDRSGRAPASNTHHHHRHRTRLRPRPA